MLAAELACFSRFFPQILGFPVFLVVGSYVFPTFPSTPRVITHWHLTEASEVHVVLRPRQLATRQAHQRHRLGPEKLFAKHQNEESTEDIHPERLTWNLKLMVWLMIFLFNWVIFRFHVHLPGCMGVSKNNASSQMISH